ncbi:transporter suffix domain-containing protein [Virgibacillus halophilus]|uniref:Transporter suffix domain-containing protein n=1 Tax=Tigheibacillus halophilus TaxID=361280 RepID=A0ABU5C8Q7_9BACI|nr:transporter suffix domain-containing protein [Virgibacillus halophilus]
MDKETITTKETKEKKSISYRFGIALLIIAVLCWLTVAITPFTPFSLTVKASIVTGSLIIGEILFWIGALLVGKEVVSKYKRYLNPKNWWKKGE